jgi:hypothetical protein
LRLGVLCYSGLFALMLLGFFLFQTHMILSDVTTNEQLRRKWNYSTARRKLYL